MFKRSIRYLIVNADDFGRSAGINRGVFEAHEHGIVTSASLMVRWPAAADAAAYSRERPNLSLGLHVDLGEWTYRDDAWQPVYEVVRLDDIAEVTDEVSRQLDAFRRLVGQDPSHIDSHQHVHREDSVRSVLVEASRRLGVPLRDVSPEVRHCGDFYGQTAVGSPLSDVISVDGLIRILTVLMPGLTELGCHPGIGDGLDSIYSSERAEEVKVLCDPRVRAAIIAEGIELWSFRSVPKVVP